MRRYLVVAHRTLGGEHLLDHLRSLAAAEPGCEFHVVVPRYHPRDQVWSDGTTQTFAQEHLDEMLETMRGAGLQATGEVGSSKPLHAIGDALDSQGSDFAGCVLSTLPRGVSRWWRSDIPGKIEKTYPAMPLTHLVAEGPAAD